MIWAVHEQAMDGRDRSARYQFRFLAWCAGSNGFCIFADALRPRES
jgi:hypothetical protein